MPSIEELSRSDLLAEAVSKLKTKTPFTAYSPGAKARTILESIQDLFGEQVDRLNIALISSLLSSATGNNLDLIADVVGVKREKRTTLFVPAGAKIVELYTLEENFGAINAGAPITIPSGTRLFAYSTERSVINYETTETVVLQPEERSKFIGIRATEAGNISNIDTNQLIGIFFTGYLDSNNNSLQIRNVAPLNFTREAEADESLRARIKDAINSLATSNLIAIRLAALSLPGVSTVKTIPFFNGIGTAKVIIQATTPTVPDYLLEVVRVAVGQVQAFATYMYVTKPQETGVQVEVNVKFRPETPQNEITNAQVAIGEALTDYINNLDIGEALIINEMVQRVMEVSDFVLDIGTPSKPFESIYVYKFSKVSGSKAKKLINTNYIPSEDEKLIVEPSIQDSIIVRSI